MGKLHADIFSDRFRSEYILKGRIPGLYRGVYNNNNNNVDYKGIQW